MSKTTLFVTLALLAAFSLALQASDDKNAGNQTKCPVMGNPINKEVFVDYEGYRYFFCCKGCVEPFLAEPGKYIEQMKAEGVTPMKLKAQSTCPVLGNPIDKTVFVDYDGQRIYFCCKGCVSEFEKDPAKYMKVLADRGETGEILKQEDKSM
jgi:YHS domain-containing protein